MKKWLKITLYSLSYLGAAALGVFITVFLNNIYKWWPHGGSFDLKTLGVYLGAAGSIGALFIIWKTTKNQLIAQNKIQKQNVDIKLFDIRNEMYKDVKNYFDEFVKNDFSQIEQLKKILENISSVKTPYFNDLGLSKVKYLFTKQVYDLVIKLKEDSNIISNRILRLKVVADYTISRKDKDGDFKTEFERFNDSEKNKEDLKRFKNVCDFFELKNIPLFDGKKENHNWFVLFTEKEKMIEKFRQDLKELLLAMEEILYIEKIDGDKMGDKV